MIFPRRSFYILYSYYILCFSVVCSLNPLEVLTTEAMELSSDDVPSWWGPFHRKQHIDPLAVPSCQGLTPGFDPDVLAVRDAIPPIKSLSDLENLEPGQKVLVVAPRFGLGNTLRNWVSAYFWALYSGRRIVILHGGKFHGVYASLCEAYSCAFDHIYGVNDTDASKLLGVFEKKFQPRQLGQHLASEGLYWNDPIVFSFSYAFWDHWWRNNRTINRCACDAVGGCHAGGGYRTAALHALLKGGPSEALKDTVEQILKWSPAKLADLALPLNEALHGRAFNPVIGLGSQFDIGLHIRTRVGSLERPGRPFGRCRGEECEKRQADEEALIRERYLSTETWECLSIFLQAYASLLNNGAPKTISIFLGTDNVILRGEFVDRLSRFGPVFFNSGSVAHVGVSSTGNSGRLPTMAEFYLMGKSLMVLELDSYMSTFAQFAGHFGNCTLVGLPRVGLKGLSCADRQPGQTGVWRKSDPRAVSNKFFRIEN